MPKKLKATTAEEFYRECAEAMEQINQEARRHYVMFDSISSVNMPADRVAYRVNTNGDTWGSWQGYNINDTWREHINSATSPWRTLRPNGTSKTENTVPMSPLQEARNRARAAVTTQEMWLAPLYSRIFTSGGLMTPKEMERSSLLYQIAETYYRARQHLLTADIEQVSIYLARDVLSVGQCVTVNAIGLLANDCTSCIPAIEMVAGAILSGSREIGQEFTNKSETTYLFWLNPALIHKDLKLEGKTAYSVYNKAYLTKTAIDDAEVDGLDLKRPKIRKLLRE